jgi:hypothetical protein
VRPCHHPLAGPLSGPVVHPLFDRGPKTLSGFKARPPEPSSGRCTEATQIHIAILLDISIPWMHSGYRSIVRHHITSDRTQ